MTKIHGPNQTYIELYATLFYQVKLFEAVWLLPFEKAEKVRT